MLKLKNCLNCNKSFQVLNYRFKIAKYCSNSCFLQRFNSSKELTGKTIRCLVCSKDFYSQPSRPRKYCSQICLGKDFAVKRRELRLNTGKTHFKKGEITWNKGLKGFKAGEEHYNWKGGVTAINHKIRESIEYEDWRKHVFERDYYTCQNCLEIGGRLHADHIKPFALFPELRLEISNGRTLCENCHSLIGAKVNQYSKRKDFEDKEIL